MKTKYILYLAAAIVVFLLVKKYLGKKQDEKDESGGNAGGGGGGNSLPSVVNPSLTILNNKRRTNTKKYVPANTRTTPKR